jgi:enterochelin esterase-like enzyme
VRAFLLLAAVCLLATPALANDRIQNRSLPAPSLGLAKRDCRVYLPPTYHQPDAMDRRYPVVFFLHGWPGSEGNWPGQGRAAESLDRLITAGEIPEVIALFPDGGGNGLLGRSIWVNAANGRSNVEDFVVHDVVSWADSTLRTKPGPRWRAVIGLSDGATASMNLVLRHPDVFGACGCLSGDFRLKHDLSSGHIFGPEPRASRLRESYSPLEYAPRVAEGAKHSTIYFDCGVDDESIRENREMDTLLTHLGVPHTYREFPGSHDWGYWRQHVRDALRAVTAGMR